MISFDLTSKSIHHAELLASLREIEFYVKIQIISQIYLY